MTAPGRRVGNHSTTFSISAPGRLVARHAVAFQVPADSLRAQNVALELKLGFTNADLLLIVEPGSRHVALAGEDEHFDDRHPAPHRVFVQQAGRGDRSVIRMGTKNHQRTRRPQNRPQRLAHVDQLAMGAASPDRIKKSDRTSAASACNSPTTMVGSWRSRQRREDETSVS